MSESQIGYAEKQPELDLGEERKAMLVRLAEIDKKIAERAIAARSAALAPVLAAIRQHRFTTDELGMTVVKGKLVPKKSDKRATIEPKYRDPINGKEWAGRGKMPTWLAARIAGGHDASEFLIVKPAASTAPADNTQAKDDAPPADAGEDDDQIRRDLAA